MFIEKKDLPYFMKNKEWYFFDKNEGVYKPTEKAPPRAVESITKFNAEHVYTDENGDTVEIDNLSKAESDKNELIESLKSDAKYLEKLISHIH